MLMDPAYATAAAVAAEDENRRREALKRAMVADRKALESTQQFLEVVLHEANPIDGTSSNIMQVDEVAEAHQAVLITINEFKISQCLARDKFKLIPNIICSIEHFLVKFHEEMEELADLSDDISALTNEFIRLVRNLQHTMRTTNDRLNFVNRQLNVLLDVAQQGMDLNPDDESDIQLARTEIGRVASCLEGDIVTSIHRSEASKKRTEEKIVTVRAKLHLVCVREDESQESGVWPEILRDGTGVAVGIMLAEEALAVPILEGDGLFMIASVAFPPFAVYVGAALILGIPAILIANLLRKVYSRHNENVKGLFGTILVHLCRLHSAHDAFTLHLSSCLDQISNVGCNVQIVALLQDNNARRTNGVSAIRNLIIGTEALQQGMHEVCQLNLNALTAGMRTEAANIIPSPQPTIAHLRETIQAGSSL